jgi:predicted transport protein
MSDIKLFRLDQKNTAVVELTSQFAKLERDLQQLVEKHMETFLGVRFLASEYTTSNKGRIDSLGLDENGCPVIIEYKRHSNENVINQGLFYLNWFLDHKADFQLLAMKVLGNDIAETIEWSGARLICIASDFNKYDEHAIQLIDRNIELMRYKYFSDDLLLLELVNTQSAQSKYHPKTESSSSTSSSKNNDKSHADSLAIASPMLLQLYNAVCDYCDSLGDDAQRKELKLYTAFKRIKNFISILVLPQQKDERINLYLKVDPSSIELQNGFSHDVTNKGHWGTGNLEVVLRTPLDLEKAKSLIQTSFENN